MAAAKATAVPEGQSTLAVEIIKQHPGPQQVERAVRVNVPGKHFPGLQPAEQKIDYEGTAVEFAHRHAFPRHLRAWAVGRAAHRARHPLHVRLGRRRRPLSQGLLDDADSLEQVAPRDVQGEPGCRVCGNAMPARTTEARAGCSFGFRVPH